MSLIIPDDASVQTHAGRTPVVICDTDRRDCFLHFIAFAPTGMDAGRARAVITDAFRTLRAANPEAWTYTDLRQALVRQHFTCLIPSGWDEATDG